MASSSVSPSPYAGMSGTRVVYLNLPDLHRQREFMSVASSQAPLYRFADVRNDIGLGEALRNPARKLGAALIALR